MGVLSSGVSQPDCAKRKSSTAEGLGGLTLTLNESAPGDFSCVHGGLGEEIKPLDRLGRDNVTVQARHKSGGSSADYSYKTSWGSYVRQVTSTKISRLPLPSILDLPEGEGSTIFSTSSQQGQARRVYLGFREKSGERIEGWLVRAIEGARIIGIAGSSPSLEEMAVHPEKLQSLLAD